MDNIKELKIDAIKKEAEKFFKDEFSGHDTLHTMRVLKNALMLQKRHGGDIFIISAAALLHDFDDKKISPQTHKGLDNAKAVLNKYCIPEDEVSHILRIIQSVSFSDGKIPDSPEGQLVQDADRLDALGAVGIARCFAWGGSHGRPIYTEMDANKSFAANGNSGIAHFYQKLLRLEALMNTAGAKEEAKKRTEFLKEYLRRFSEEADITFDFI